MRRRESSGDRHLATIETSLERLPPQTEALKRARAAFADAADWEQAFTSSDPDEVNRVVQVKGNYENIVNHLMKIIKSSHALVGLGEPKERSARSYIRSVRDAGGLTDGQADAVIRLQSLRSRLQHASPDVEPDEVWEEVEALQRLLPRARRKLLVWLESNGHPILT